MHGLPHASILAQELLSNSLGAHGYTQSKIVLGLGMHALQLIHVDLLVDNLVVKYIGTEHAVHLMSALKQHYNVCKDWKGEKFIGLVKCTSLCWVMWILP